MEFWTVRTLLDDVLRVWPEICIIWARLNDQFGAPSRTRGSFNQPNWTEKTNVKETGEFNFSTYQTENMLKKDST